MGGSVSVSSQVGKGSEFIIKLKTKAKVNQMMERPVKDVESFKSDKKYKK
jgi:chemotaxis protein histidine kinase CheA